MCEFELLASDPIFFQRLIDCARADVELGRGRTQQHGVPVHATRKLLHGLLRVESTRRFRPRTGITCSHGPSSVPDQDRTGTAETPDLKLA